MSADVRRVLALAVPLALKQLVEVSGSLVDTLLVGPLGTAAIAGIGISVQTYSVALAVMIFFDVATTILVSNRFGAPRAERWELIRQVLAWGGLGGIAMALLLGALSTHVLYLYELEPAVRTIAEGDLRLRTLSLAFGIPMVLCLGVFAASGRATLATIIVCGSTLLDTALSYGLIYGRLSLPELGYLGSAVGTLIAHAFGLAIALFCLIKGWRPKGIGRFRFDLALLRQLVRLGAPPALEHALVSASFAAQSFVVTFAGTFALAAYRIAFQVFALAMVPAMAVGVATMILVGQELGSGRPGRAPALLRAASIGVVIWLGAGGLACATLGAPFMASFTAEPKVIEQGRDGLVVAGLALPVLGLVFVHWGYVRGLGDTMGPSIVMSAGNWLIVCLGAVPFLLYRQQLAVLWTSALVVLPLMLLCLALIGKRRMTEIVRSNAEGALA